MEKSKPARRNAVEIDAATLPTQDKKLRVVVLGAPRVGKTQLVSRFLGRPFTESYIPTIEDFHRLRYIIAGHTYQLDVLDPSGQTLNPSLQNLTLLTGDLFLVLYSIGNRETWNRAKEIITEIEEVLCDAVGASECLARNFKTSLLSDGGNVQPDKFENGILERSKFSTCASPINIFLVGNKCDLLDKKVESIEVETWLNQREHYRTTTVEHRRISAKTSNGISAFFDKVFTKSNFPIEFSPNRHTKVTESEYSSAVSLLGKSPSLVAHKREKLDEIYAIARAPHSLNDRQRNDEKQKSQTDAIALLCPNERRPSIDTEVLLAISKVRSVVCEVDVATHDDVTATSRKSSSKLKKQLGKLTGLILH